MPARINIHPDALALEARWRKAEERTRLAFRHYRETIEAAAEAWFKDPTSYPTVFDAEVAAEARWYARDAPFITPDRCYLCDQFVPCPCNE
mgnify:CR=1 FL=1